jgi:hypothetical protein
MCKLNILCKELDGKCSCSNPGGKILDKPKEHNGILSAILAYLRSQPDILRALREDPGAEERNGSRQQLIEEISAISSPPTQAGSLDGVSEVSICLLSSSVPKIIVGKAFPLMLDLVESKSEAINLTQMTTFIAILAGKDDNSEKCRLGEVETTGTIFFRRLVVTKAYKDVNLVVKTKNESSIIPFVMQIQTRQRKADSFKSEKILV